MKILFVLLTFLTSVSHAEVLFLPDFKLNVISSSSLKFISANRGDSSSYGFGLEIEPSTSPYAVQIYAHDFKLENSTITIPFYGVTCRLETPNSTGFEQSYVLGNEYTTVFNSYDQVDQSSPTVVTLHININVPENQKAGVYRSKLFARVK